MNGFRTCGVYPSNPAAISVPEEPESGDEDSNSGDNDNNGGLGSDFMDEQCTLFQRRFSEGYNLDIDPDYLRWLKIHHPDTASDPSRAVGSGAVTSGSGGTVGGQIALSGGSSAAVGGGTPSSGGSVGGGTPVSGGAVGGGTPASGGAVGGGTPSTGGAMSDEI